MNKQVLRILEIYIYMCVCGCVYTHALPHGCLVRFVFPVTTENL